MLSSLYLIFEKTRFLYTSIKYMIKKLKVVSPIKYVVEKIFEKINFKK